MKLKNERPLSNFLRENYHYENVDLKTIKPTSSISYKDAKEAAQVEDLTNHNRFRKWLSYIKITSLVIVSIAILGSISTIYYVAFTQFLGYSTSSIVNMAWLVQDTCIILMGAIFGLFIKDIFK